MKMRHVVLALAFSTAFAASAQTVVDVMMAFDRTAAEWLGRTGKDPSAFAQNAIGEMNAVLPATGLDESFRFGLAGTFLSHHLCYLISQLFIIFKSAAMPDKQNPVHHHLI